MTDMKRKLRRLLDAPVGFRESLARWECLDPTYRSPFKNAPASDLEAGKKEDQLQEGLVEETDAIEREELRGDEL